MTTHASAVSIDGKGLLILGSSGSGKSALALELIALGAQLIADDRVLLTRQEDRLIAESPPALSGLIEARGVGLLHAQPAGPTPITVVVDLGQAETERLPQFRHIEILGVQLPLVLGPAGPHLGISLRQLILCGRSM